jgi:hypothetical protein
MTRLILMALLVAGMLAVLSLALGPTRPVLTTPQTPLTPRKKEDTMPATFHTIAYVLLIVLMCGVASGWLGAA